MLPYESDEFEKEVNDWILKNKKTVVI
jgi:hypothetical protein